MKSYQESRRINTILVYAMLGAGAVLMIFPFLWMLLTSFKSAGESVQIPPTILPKEWLADNYEKALIALPFHKTVYQHRPSDPFQGNLRSGILIRGRICICQA